jgi:hypothetical protein
MAKKKLTEKVKKGKNAYVKDVKKNFKDLIGI